MDLDHALAFARANRQAVLVTMRNDGLPQLSNVVQRTGDDGIVRVSITADRAKYKNLVRRPWAAVHLTTPDFRPYAVLEGDVELMPVATSPDDATADELVEYYRAISGEHNDWDDYRAAMVRDGRTVARITPTRAYGTA